MKNTNKGVLFGLFDSTGHGIPAAMLSISGTIMLKELIYSMEVSDTKLLLQLLNQQLITTFNTGDYNIAQKEVFIFNYDATRNKLQYSSAKWKAFF
ncbi:MAG: SpoIIE family protein phosphatase [Bacteroidia bacterium]